MKVVELFCGCGGFSRGAHDAGFKIAAAYDIDPVLTSSYQLNFPETPLHLRDVALLTGSQIRKDVGGDVFGIFGGPPCQGFSEIGKRNPSDPRRDLLGHFFRIVREVEPAFFIMENVRGLAYPGARHVLDSALQSVSENYDILGPVVWEAAQFGAATTRPRMFVVGLLKSRGVAITKKHVERLMAPATTVADAIGDLMGAKLLRSDPNLPGFDRWKIDGRRSSSAYAKTLRTTDGVFSSHRVTVHTSAVVARFAATAPGSFEKVGRHPRLASGGQCPTLRAGTGVEKGSFQSVRPIHPTENRVITVREAARLQGFPDHHFFHPTVWHSFRMIGNSVSPIIAKAMFLALADALGLALHNGVQVERKVTESGRVRRARRWPVTRGHQHVRRWIALTGR
jgi:DNA (cytosine-5)-methyltransferase 1